MSEDTPEAAVYLWYVWDCPECGETQEAEPPDVDPSGETLECRDCGRDILIASSTVL